MSFRASTVLRISAPAALLAALALAGCGKLGGQDSQTQAAEQWPLVNKYCSDCHNSSDLAGGLDFAKIKPENFAQHAETLEKAVRKLRGHLMPPPKEPRPGRAAAHVVRLVARELSRRGRGEPHGYPAIAAASAQPQGIRERGPRSARARLRRGRVPAAGRRGQALRQHRGGAAGVAVVHRAVRDRRARRRGEGGRPAECAARRQDFPAGAGTQLTHVPGLPLGTRGGIARDASFPSDGEYAINIADMATAIWGNGLEFENTLVVTLDDKPIYETVARRRRGHEAVRPGAGRRDG